VISINVGVTASPFPLWEAIVIPLIVITALLPAHAGRSIRPGYLPVFPFTFTKADNITNPVDREVLYNAG